jgi:CHASE3 domain sensor protein
MDLSTIVVVILLMVLAAGAVLWMEIHSRRTGADKHERNTTNVALNEE